MHISITLEPECSFPWRANYHGFSIPEHTLGKTLLNGERISGHYTRTYEFLMTEVIYDLSRGNLQQIPPLTFSENIEESLIFRTQSRITEKITQQIQTELQHDKV